MFLAEDLISGYTRFKKVRSKMDYEDLIVLTRALLENRAVADWVLFKLDGGIDHVLIDEAQDTSPDQWAIVKALTADFFAGEGAGEAVRHGICRRRSETVDLQFSGCGSARF